MATPLPSTPRSQSGIAGGIYENGTLKGKIKLDPKLGDENYQTWNEAMELLLAAGLKNIEE